MNKELDLDGISGEEELELNGGVMELPPSMNKENKDDLKTDKNGLIIDTFDDFVKRHENDSVDNIVLDKEAVSNSLSTVIGDLKDIDVINITEAIMNYKNKKINASECYSKFPENIKKAINDKAIRTGYSGINAMNSLHKAFVEDMVNAILQEALFDQYNIDMNKEIDQLQQKLGLEIIDMYQSSMRERIAALDKILDSLEESNKEGSKAYNLIYNIKAGMQESINQTQLKEFAKKVKIKKFDLEKPNKIFTEFNSKYEKSKYMNYDINQTLAVLDRSISSWTTNDTILFLVIFCKYCSLNNFTPENMYQHCYMFYTFTNILHITSDNGAEDGINNYNILFKNNIIEVLSNYKNR